MPRWVLLQHTLPDSTWHFDWLIQPSDTNPQAPLIAFRSALSPVDPAVIAFPAERIQDHRPDYLDYEGPISNNRGQVRRIAQGRARILRDDDQFHIILDEDRHWKGLRQGIGAGRVGMGAMGGNPVLYQFHLSDHPEFG
jgi:hypothetical protein